MGTHSGSDFRDTSCCYWSAHWWKIEFDAPQRLQVYCMLTQNIIVKDWKLCIFRVSLNSLFLFKWDSQTPSTLDDKVEVEEGRWVRHKWESRGEGVVSLSSQKGDEHENVTAKLWELCTKMRGMQLNNWFLRGLPIQRSKREEKVRIVQLECAAVKNRDNGTQVKHESKKKTCS